MEDVTRKLKEIIGGVTQVLIAAIGLLIVSQVVFGSGIYDVVGNITALVDTFIGASASLASVIALIIVLGVIPRN
jgi:hypothetical protein|tara:strand:- start:220 stop:444 length:225 start_codon:yes stop_codon:yes gene_type:complete